METLIANTVAIVRLPFKLTMISVLLLSKHSSKLAFVQNGQQGGLKNNGVLPDN